MSRPAARPLYALLANALWCAAAVAAAPARRQRPAPARHRPRRRPARHPDRLPHLPGADPARLPRPASPKTLFLSRDPAGAVAAALLSPVPRPSQPQRAPPTDAAPAPAPDREWTGRAQRAARFIEEFEQAGRGWFWETTGRGALSYVSEHLAADLQIARRGSDRPALLRADRRRRGRRIRADAGLPPLRPPALHRHHRARQHQRRNLVVAVGHAELRRAWPLPRLPRHRHRSDPAAPLRRGDQPPRQV